MAIVPRSVGQEEKLTSRISGLVRSYPKGVGIIKEFIQNADDAGATSVTVTMDWRTHDVRAVPEGAKDDFRELYGPGLVISNDRPFTPDDIENIQEIGDSDKALDVSKTGRFGLGFNACYNVTEAPSFVTRDSFLCFDPQRSFTDTPKPGVGWALEDLWGEHPDLLAPYTEGHLKQGEEFSEGTTFRLPLRTTDQAGRSEISADPFTARDFEEVLGKATEAASDLILFLKSVVNLEVWEISSAGERTLRLRIRTENKSEVEAERKPLREYVGGSHEALVERLSDPAPPPSVSYSHRVLVESDGARWSEMWRVVSGLYRDEGRTLIEAMQEMAGLKEKTVPWAGAAALIEATGGPHEADLALEGQAFCFLPLPQQTGVPVHLNGFFDPDDARQGVTHDPDTTGNAALRTRWNELLIEHAVAPAYATLLQELSRNWAPESIEAYYDLWPRQTSSSAPFDQLRSRVYELLADAPIVFCSGGDSDRWRALGDVLLLPRDRPGLRAPLIADGANVPDEAFPAAVRDALAKGGAQKHEISPPLLRERLRRYGDPNVAPQDASHACLREPRVAGGYARILPVRQSRGRPPRCSAGAHVRREAAGVRHAPIPGDGRGASTLSQASLLVPRPRILRSDRTRQGPLTTRFQGASAGR